MVVFDVCLLLCCWWLVYGVWLLLVLLLWLLLLVWCVMWLRVNVCNCVREGDWLCVYGCVVVLWVVCVG